MGKKANDLIEYKFEGKPVGVFTWRGRKAALAREVGLALGYERQGEQFVKNVTGEWAEELREGRDYEVVRGDDLPVLKQVLGVTGESPVTFASHLVVLFDVGIRLTGFLAKKPRAATFRRWLAEEVLPQIEATGSYSPVTPKALPEAKPVGLLEQTIAPLKAGQDELFERVRVLEARRMKQLPFGVIGTADTEEELREKALDLAGDASLTFTSRESLARWLGASLALGRSVVDDLFTTGDLVKDGPRIVAKKPRAG